MLTWTNQPYESMWNHIRLLKYSTNVKKLLTGKLLSNRNFFFSDQELVERKSRQIAYAISQADEYFKAADNVSEITSPLLYFYGMLSLVKALLVANTQNLLLDDIKYHGLFTRAINENLKKYVERENEWCIEKEFAVCNEGVLDELTKLVHNFSFPKHSIILFKDILKLNPELGDFYTKYYGEPASFLPLYSYDLKTFPFKLYPATTDKKKVLASFPNIEKHFEVTADLLHGQALVIQSREYLKEMPNNIGIYYPIPGGRYLIAGLDYEHESNTCSYYISPEICDYIGMFILSNCVRYKQELWGMTVSGERDGGFGLVNLFISIARTRFPNFILSQLFNEKFEYGVAARLM
ncbi:YaaC family protein [Fischerella sp. PCC 9605]|uniref:YaaC family protein n=1 Tax=Fischerella sp. PCC 9605 TaxID=1173024 RepID=UPI00047CF704|nr:YaaC family protein [Fischerella sp. PCC 9605]